MGNKININPEQSISFITKKEGSIYNNMEWIDKFAEKLIVATDPNQPQTVQPQTQPNPISTPQQPIAEKPAEYDFERNTREFEQQVRNMPLNELIPFAISKGVTINGINDLLNKYKIYLLKEVFSQNQNKKLSPTVPEIKNEFLQLIYNVIKEKISNSKNLISELNNMSGYGIRDINTNEPLSQNIDPSKSVEGVYDNSSSATQQNPTQQQVQPQQTNDQKVNMVIETIKHSILILNGTSLNFKYLNKILQFLGLKMNGDPSKYLSPNKQIQASEENKVDIFGILSELSQEQKKIVLDSIKPTLEEKIREVNIKQPKVGLSLSSIGEAPVQQSVSTAPANTETPTETVPTPNNVQPSTESANEPAQDNSIIEPIKNSILEEIRKIFSDFNNSPYKTKHILIYKTKINKILDSLGLSISLNEKKNANVNANSNNLFYKKSAIDNSVINQLTSLQKSKLKNELKLELSSILPTEFILQDTESPQNASQQSGTTEVPTGNQPPPAQNPIENSTQQPENQIQNPIENSTNQNLGLTQKDNVLILIKNKLIPLVDNFDSSLEKLKNVTNQIGSNLFKKQIPNGLSTLSPISKNPRFLAITDLFDEIQYKQSNNILFIKEAGFKDMIGSAIDYFRNKPDDKSKAILFNSLKELLKETYSSLNSIISILNSGQLDMYMSGQKGWLGTGKNAPQQLSIELEKYKKTFDDLYKNLGREGSQAGIRELNLIIDKDGNVYEKGTEGKQQPLMSAPTSQQSSQQSLQIPDAIKILKDNKYKITDPQGKVVAKNNSKWLKVGE